MLIAQAVVTHRVIYKLVIEIKKRKEDFGLLSKNLFEHWVVINIALEPAISCFYQVLNFSY